MNQPRAESGWLDQDWTTQRVGLLGMGREGQASYNWLKQRYPELPLTVFTESEPDPSWKARLGSQDQLRVGPFTAERLCEFDCLVRSPGISPYRQPLAQARSAGVRFTSGTSLWFHAHPHARTIAVTGTKGKSTTSALIAHLLEGCGHRVQLAGNIGQPLLACKDYGVDWWVVELSSYQLCDLEARPGISVALNFSPEHLDWHGSEERYRADKLRLLDLAPDQPAVVNALDPHLRDYCVARRHVHWFNNEEGIRVEPGLVWWHGQDLPVEIPSSLAGAHNRSNLAAALTVLNLVGADRALALRAVRDFEGLAHRFQVVAERRGISWIDDSIATTPVATTAALSTLAPRSVILLIGGLDRGIDWSPHFELIRSHVPRAIIGLPDSGNRLLAELAATGISCAEGMHAVANLGEGVGLAARLAREGDVVLLSPGAPSYPHFRDFEHRGRHFLECLERITESPPGEGASRRGEL